MESSSAIASLPPLLEDKMDTYTFNKIYREQGEAAAIAAKRQADAPRLIEQLQKKDAREKTDLELLSNGGWKEVVLEALGEDIAGEEDLKLIGMFSISGTCLCNDYSKKTPLLHIFIPGDSQIGKSWVFRHCGKTLLPPGDFLSFTSMSAKGLDYLADAENDPYFYKGKVLFVDETADQSPAARAKLKIIMSGGQDEVSNLTVDDKKKSKRQSFKAMPTVWSCSAEAFEDAERQFLNRPLILSVDSSVGQTQKIHIMQRDQEVFGSYYTPQSKKEQALRLMSKIRDERNAEVLVLFADYYQPDNEDSRSMIPQFGSLVKAIAFAHRFARPTTVTPDGHKIIFATIEDGIEATRLWGKFVKHKTTHLAERFIQVLETLNEVKSESGQMTLDIGDVEKKGKKLEDLTVELNYKLGKNWSINYVRNMLSTLNSEGLAEYHECNDGKNRWVAISHPSHASHFIDVMNITDGGAMLAKRIEDLKTRSSHRHMENGLELPEGLKYLIMGDAVLGVPAPAETGAMPIEAEHNQDEKIAGLKKLIQGRKLSLNDLERIVPEQRATIELLRHKGRIGVQGNGIFYWVK
jgi:hypothetical protein